MLSDVLAKLDSPVLIHPGWQDSDADHWQTLWQHRYQFSRVNQDDWLTPKMTDWTRRLADVIQQQTRPPVLVTHSLGGITVAQTVRLFPDVKIRAAFIVAPPDLDRPDSVPELVSFKPTPRARLPFPTMIVCSANDPYCSLESSRALAQAWGSDLRDIGDRHHIGDQANLGQWHEGQSLLAQFLSSIQVG